MDQDLSVDYRLSNEEYKMLVSEETCYFLEERNKLEKRISELKNSIKTHRDSGNYLNKQYDEIYDLMKIGYFRMLEYINFLKDIELYDKEAIKIHNNLVKKLEKRNKENFDELYSFIEGQLNGDIPSASIVPC